MLTGNVHGHLLNLGAVELLNLTHHANIVGGDEVNRNTLPAETTATADTVNVVLPVGGEIVVDDQGNLLHVDTTGEQIGGDQNTGGTGAELLHDDITLALVHVSVHGGDGEVTGSELVGEPVDLSAGVAEDDGLSNGDGLVKIGEGVQLPVFLLDGDVELLDTFKGEFVLLDENTDGVAHELGGDLEHILGHGGREEDNLGGLREELEDIVDLLGETARQHLVGLIKDEHLHAVGLEDTALDHVVDTAGGTDDDLGAVLEGLHVIPDAGAANAGVALDLHEVTDGDHNLLDLLGQLAGGGEDESLAGLDVRVDLLENGDGEGGGLAGTGLGLGDHVVTCGEWVRSGSARALRALGLTLDDGHDGTLLDSRRALETVGVDSTEELALEVHRIEGIGGLIVVGFNLGCGRGKRQYG